MSAPGTATPRLPRTAVIGATGYLGRALYQAHLAADARTVGTSRAPRRGGELLPLDLADKRTLRPRLRELGIEEAIIAAGIATVARCEAEQARSAEINVTGTQQLLEALREQEIRPVFISTDLVFDGERGAYTEIDEPHPIVAYGEQKRAVEQLLAEMFDGRALILRVSKVFSTTRGDGTLLDELAATWAAGGVVRAAVDQRFNPILREDFVRVVLHLQRLCTCGLVHLCGDNAWTRHELAERLAARLSVAPSRLERIAIRDLGIGPVRPRDTTMSNRRLRQLYREPFADMEACLDEVARQYGAPVFLPPRPSSPPAGGGWQGWGLPAPGGAEAARSPFRVPFLDLRVVDPVERRGLLDAVDRILAHGRVVGGPEVADLEAELAARCERRFACGVGSGTAALTLALGGLGVGPGDEVVVPALSFVATANAVALLGARPVFADIRADLNIDPESAAACIGPRTRAVVVVHYAGRCGDMAALTTLCEDRRVALVEDAAQAWGARYCGRPAGSFGLSAALSMNAMKILAACGECGAVLTDCEEIRARIGALTYNGIVNKEICQQPSSNYRMDTLQAAMLLYRLQGVEKVIARRRQIAQYYDDALGDILQTPPRSAESFDVYYSYIVRTEHRDDLLAHLAAHGVEAKVQHPLLMCQQPAYRDRGAPAVSNADHLVSRILSLPVNEKLSDEQTEIVVAGVRGFLGKGGA
ncbi:MAG: DegT/DnrJ/EryC1/StrS family aminotransferase [Candidatus Schekmanbacteria bacterium]|nr:DegT/DnrJ/EryC1/StrS family aminotransferase [Candidatus Schekmanbacteria bacterium]